MKKPLIDWVWTDPQYWDKKIYVCIFLVFMLISAAVIKLMVGTGPVTYIIPSLFLIPIIRHWQRERGKRPKFTLNSEGFCIGNHWSLISLNNEGKRKWGKPHLFLWEDIQFFELDDRDPDANVFSWTLKPGVTTPDAPNHFFFGDYRDQTYFEYEEEKEGSLYEEEDSTLAMGVCHAEAVLELMILLKVAKQEDYRRSVLEKWKTMTTPNRSIEDLEPEERQAAEALIKERDQLIVDAGDLELHHDMETETVDTEELGDLFTRGMEANRILRKQNITPPRPKLSLGMRIQLVCGAIITIAIVIALIYGFITLMWEAFFVN
jgi:hypothetical protein